MRYSGNVMHPEFIPNATIECKRETSAKMLALEIATYRGETAPDWNDVTGNIKYLEQFEYRFDYDTESWRVTWQK